VNEDQGNDFMKQVAGIFQDDQQRTAWANLAGMLFAYMQECKNAGFTPQEALYMAAQFQAAMLGKNPGKP
jgi:hypothetical protein